MKTALYFDEQDAQLVLTAESEWERTILKMIKERLPAGLAFEGGFYGCQGGWIRHNITSPHPYSYNANSFDGSSLIVRMPKPVNEEVTQ